MPTTAVRVCIPARKRDKLYTTSKGLHDRQSRRFDDILVAPVLTRFVIGRTTADMGDPMITRIDKLHEFVWQTVELVRREMANAPVIEATKTLVGARQAILAQSWHTLSAAIR